MDNNTDVGLKTNPTDKLAQEAKDRLKSAQVDYDFYSTPFIYSSVEPESANHLFGNGKWKQECKSAFGDETFDKHSEKYGNKPVDFKIASFITKQAKYFQPEEKIKIVDNNGIYDSTGKVLACDKNKLIIMLPFNGTSTGKIINLSRMEGAKKAVEKHSKLVNELDPVSEVETKKEVVSMENPVDHIEKSENKPEENDNSGMWMKLLLLALLIGAVIAFIKYSSSKKQA